MEIDPETLEAASIWTDTVDDSVARWRQLLGMEDGGAVESGEVFSRAAGGDHGNSAMAGGGVIEGVVGEPSVP